MERMNECEAETIDWSIAWLHTEEELIVSTAAQQDLAVSGKRQRSDG
jgi:hypothetical protein